MKFISFLLLFIFICPINNFWQEKHPANEFLLKLYVDISHENYKNHFLDFPFQTENNSSEEEYEKDTEKLENENKLKIFSDFFICKYFNSTQNSIKLSFFNAWNLGKSFYCLKLRRFILFLNLRN